MSDAKFSINDDSSDYGYEATLGEVLTLKPRANPGSDIRTYTFEVVVKPFVTPDLPELPVGSPVALTPTPLSPLDVTFPSSGTILAYKIRGQINGGVRQIGGPNGLPITEVVPEWTHERIVLYRTGSGQRPIVATERFEFDQFDGWTSAINDMVDNWGAGAVVGPVASTLDAIATWGNLLGGTLLDNPLVRVSAGKLLLGANPPTLGAINLSSAQAIYWETTPGPATNMRVLTVDGSNNLILGSNDPDFTGDMFFQTDQGRFEFQVDGTPDLKVEQTLTTSLNPVAIGSAPAASGDLRLSKLSSIRVNNNAEADYIPAIATNAADRLLLGANYVGNAGMSLDVKTAHTIELNVAGTTELTVAGSKVTVANELNTLGTMNHDGALVGFRGTDPAPMSPAYTLTNSVVDRAFDANATTIHELADVLATVIGDLQVQGLLGSP